MANTRKKPRPTFGGDFRKFFVRGLAVLLPSVLTLWILFYAYRFVDANVAEPINAGVRRMVLSASPHVFAKGNEPTWWTVSADQLAQERRERAGGRQVPTDTLIAQVRAQNLKTWWDDHWYLRLIGLVIAIVLIYLAGLLLGGFIGRRIFVRFDDVMRRAPLFRLIYPHVKQVVEFLFGESQRVQFNRVVLVQYPRKGIWSVGLMTGGAMRDAESLAGGECITVFIPSSPTPFTGYTITIRKEDALDLPITIDEALRFVVSGGVLVPDKQLSPYSSSELAARAAAAPPADGAGDPDDAPPDPPSGGQRPGTAPRRA